MDPPESPTHHRENQATGRRKRRPRLRRCLLKGCEQRFHPRDARQRYCSSSCQQAARKWSRWKAQERYRATASGKEKRNSQSRRYRERVRSRKAAAPDGVDEPTRVITKNFFRVLLRPARLLRAVRPSAAKSLTALLLRRVSASVRAGAPTRATLEAMAHLSHRY